MATKRHSEAVLTDLRDGWWSQDYLALVAERLGMRDCRRLLDVGCGHGHWGQRLLPLSHAAATMVGVDQELDWVAKASARAAALEMDGQCSYQLGTAEALDFEDGCFDLVTCQTLVMHVAEPKIVLREMLRVLAPGGLLVLAEPSNLPNQFSTDTVNRATSPEDLSEVAYLFICCSRGRAQLGRGDDSIADVLPTLLLDLGVEDLWVVQNEKAVSILPPYSEETAAELRQEASYADKKFWLWDREDAHTLFVAGGGKEDRFDRSYEIFLGRDRIFREQVEAGIYARIGGGHHYLISARASCAR